MILSKSLNQKSGFTFVELMIALFIISTTLSALFSLQNIVFSRLMQSYHRATRIFLSKKISIEKMYDLDQKEEETGKESIDDPKTTITWKDSKISPQGMYENMANLYKIHVQGKWTTFSKDQTEDLLSIKYVPPKEEEEQEGEEIEGGKQGEKQKKQKK